MDKKIVLITGASSGIGLRTAVDLANAGYTVYGGARRVEPMQPIIDAGGYALSLDVTDDKSMQAAVNTVMDAEGRIDVLVNNAGYGLYGAVEDITMDTARHQIETNILGLARMTQLVLPGMRERGQGRIINISSIGGTIHTPFGAWYHGTKWFVEGFTNAMRLEVEDRGIFMVIVAPGLIDTGFNDVVGKSITKNSGDGPYRDTVKQLVKAAENPPSYVKGSDPKVVSNAIRRAIEDPKPRAIYRAGKMSVLLYLLRRLLPFRVFDNAMKAAIR